MVRIAFASIFVLLAGIIGASPAGAAGVEFRPIFHGAMHDCDGPDFGDHLPKGFICKGTGTGVAVCTRQGDRRVISVDIQVNYCHLDWVSGTGADEYHRPHRPPRLPLPLCVSDPAVGIPANVPCLAEVGTAKTPLIWICDREVCQLIHVED